MNHNSVGSHHDLADRREALRRAFHEAAMILGQHTRQGQLQEGEISGLLLSPRSSDESFDLIACFETIGHLMYPDRAIASFYDLLKDHGTLPVMTATPLGEKVHRRFLKD